MNCEILKRDTIGTDKNGPDESCFCWCFGVIVILRLARVVRITRGLSSVSISIKYLEILTKSSLINPRIYGLLSKCFENILMRHTLYIILVERFRYMDCPIWKS